MTTRMTTPDRAGRKPVMVACGGNSRPRPAAAIRVGAIVAAVARVTGHSRDEIAGNARWAKLMPARQAVCRIATRAGRSLGDIGRGLGGRDHTTVLHHLRRADGLTGDAAAELARIEAEAWEIVDKTRDWLVLLEPVKAAALAARLRAEIPRPPAPPEPTAVAAPPPAIRPRAGFVNSRGEIIVGENLRDVR